jgi:hypothetical protein
VIHLLRMHGPTCKINNLYGDPYHSYDLYGDPYHPYDLYDLYDL